ncbi:hypothetical protein OHA40_19570 [Nocardia sp. NBC_00508]|uniref:hypothetical protein n=1 Tax=Nocardia sp. NBC_00508 TaxID=2975992 RepID=UPI002E82377B|nr:hypothetical protein [Nocardia sp. NBC_00508]WUD63934.1 hypothetical protein OHA40_19570 [Nocardia sp. NBC_00508]
MQGTGLACQQVARRASPVRASSAAPLFALTQGLRVPSGTDTLSVPIGAPVFDTRLYTLGAPLRPVPVTTPGELYLSGVQLARGGIVRSGPATARLVADSCGRRDGLSAEPDLARWTTHGAPDRLGRTDSATAAEQAVAQAPGNGRIGRDDDYCTPGGKSSATTQVARLAAEPSCPLEVRDVFTASMVDERAELVERAGGSGGASLVAQLRARPRPPLVPLSPARQRPRYRDPFRRSGACPIVPGSRGAADAFEVLHFVDDAEAIAFELPELSVSTSTLDTGATTLDLQLMVTENPAGAGLGEGSASAGIQAGSRYATHPIDEATVAGHAHRFVGFLHATPHFDIRMPDLSSVGAARIQVKQWLGVLFALPTDQPRPAHSDISSGCAAAAAVLADSAPDVDSEGSRG